MKTSNQRLASIDAYRGFVMLLMMAEVLQLAMVAEAKPASGLWQFLGFHQSHVVWVGCSLHDLIQPSFSLLVGVSLPFSVNHRKSRGDTDTRILIHIIKRALILIGLGIFLRSQYSTQTYFTFEDTLTQIGLGYAFLYLTFRANRVSQWAIFISILVGYWTLFALYPLPTSSLIHHDLLGFAQHWNFNTNAAWAFDTYFLNLFPRAEPFTGNEGGYVTLSFIPTLATMMIGVYATQILQSRNLPLDNIKQLVKTGIILVFLSLIFHYLEICPIVKRIWTPSWVLLSGGICLILLALFYFIIDIKQHVKWAKMLTIIGTNSIAAYVIADALRPYTVKSVKIHFGDSFSQILGAAYQPLVFGSLILTIEILILWWMFRKKFFVKI
jgi:predicted acyltransferase